MHRTPLIQGGGLGAVLAPEKTAAAIFAALRARSVYATSGPRIILDDEHRTVTFSDVVAVVRWHGTRRINLPALERR